MGPSPTLCSLAVSAEHVPGGFDVVFDGIAEDGYRHSLAALKRGGLLCAYGYSAGVQAQRRMRTMLMWIARLYLSEHDPRQR